MTKSNAKLRYANVAANYVGVSSSLLVGIVLVPVYVRFLGAESYGIIGFFMTLYGLLQIMDLGLGMALNRELARRSATGSDGQATANLVRTIESISWIMGSTLGLAIWGGSDFLASRWLVAQTLSTEVIGQAIALMGVTIALQWPGAIYGGGLMGLERQVRAVAITTTSNVVFAVGAIGLLYLSPSIVTFFIWRAAVSLSTTVAQRQSLWSRLPGVNSTIVPRFDWRSLAGIWRFSLGVAGVSLTGIVLVQLDKVIVSRALTLDRFGAYMVASTAAAIIPQFVSPIFSATLPALAQAVAREDHTALRAHFHLASQLLSVVVFPISFAVAFFSAPLLLVWTRNPTIAQEGASILAVLAMGALLNSIMVPFYAVQLAAGWTRVAMATNCVLIAIVVPYGYFATQRWGAVGAASTWLVLNGVYVLLGSTLTLRKLLAGAVSRWLLIDVGRPIVVSFLLTWAFHQLFPSLRGIGQTLGVVSVVTAVTMLVVALISRDLRQNLVALSSRWRVR